MLIDEVKAKCKVLGYSPKTFDTYWHTTTQIYTHVEQNSAASNRSPLDLLRV